MGAAITGTVSRIVFLHNATIEQFETKVLKKHQRRWLRNGTSQLFNMQELLYLDCYFRNMSEELLDSDADEAPTVFFIKITYKYNVIVKATIVSGGLSLLGYVAAFLKQ